MGHYAVITWVQRAEGTGDERDAALLSLLVTAGRPNASSYVRPARTRLDNRPHPAPESGKGRESRSKLYPFTERCGAPRGERDELPLPAHARTAAFRRPARRLGRAPAGRVRNACAARRAQPTTQEWSPEMLPPTGSPMAPPQPATRIRGCRSRARRSGGPPMGQPLMGPPPMGPPPKKSNGGVIVAVIAGALVARRRPARRCVLPGLPRRQGHGRLQPSSSSAGPPRAGVRRPRPPAAPSR